MEVAASPARGAARRRVVVVDDHAAFADLLGLALDGLADLEYAGTARTPAAAVELVERVAPQIAVVDLMLGAENGLDLVRRLRAARPDLVLVVSSARSDTGTLTAAAMAGANGFAPKSGEFAELLNVLRTARAGAVSVAPSLLFGPGGEDEDAGPERLTTRESEVLRLMGGGASVPEIARVLNISLNTCRSHVRAVHTKLGVRTQLEAVVTAQRLGLLRTADGP
jgi:DNA-binding NarL/FixJ family response regulator